MIKTHLIPQQDTILIAVPQNYIGKQVEVLVYTMDELQEEKPKANTMSQYKGLLSKDEANELQQQATKSREEWSNNI
jgi:hypothetical protein